MNSPRIPRIFALPLEVRRIIYEFCLCFDRVEPEITWLDYFAYWSGELGGRGTRIVQVPAPIPRPWPIKVRLKPMSMSFIPLESVLGLHGVCRQIYAECKGIFWSKNRFEVGHDWGLFYFSYGLGPSRRQYISCVGIGVGWLVNRGCSEEMATELFLGKPTVHLSQHVDIRPNLEYRFVRSVIEAVALYSGAGDFDTRLQRYREESATMERAETIKDKTAECCIDSNDQMRSSVDILGEALEEYGKGQLERQRKYRQGWHIEYERCLSSGGSYHRTWLTNISAR